MVGNLNTSDEVSIKIFHFKIAVYFRVKIIFRNGKPSLKILTLPPMNSYPRLLLYRNRCPAAADEIQV